MIYFLLDEHNQAIKIGFTDSGIDSRIASLQTGNPSRLSLLCLIPGSRAKERAWHRRLQKWRFRPEEPRSEWFRAMALSHHERRDAPGPREGELWWAWWGWGEPGAWEIVRVPDLQGVCQWDSPVRVRRLRDDKEADCVLGELLFKADEWDPAFLGACTERHGGLTCAICDKEIASGETFVRKNIRSWHMKCLPNSNPPSVSDNDDALWASIQSLSPWEGHPADLLSALEPLPSGFPDSPIKMGKALLRLRKRFPTRIKRLPRTRNGSRWKVAQR